MSRCYPYPPPGYEKKAYVEPPLSSKKDKHKHKDKKQKRRKDKETNSYSKPHDKDKRLKRNHQSGHVEGMPNLVNGVHSEDMPNLVNGNFTRSEAVHVDATKILQASRTGETTLTDVLDSNRKGLELDCMADQTSLISNSFRASTSGNGAAISGRVRLSSSIAVSEIVDELNRQRRVEFMPQVVEKMWSAVDDQEWLFVRDNQLQIRPKETEKAESPPRVSANAILLPSVGVYALPYVVLD